MVMVIVRFDKNKICVIIPQYKFEFIEIVSKANGMECVSAKIQGTQKASPNGELALSLFEISLKNVPPPEKWINSKGESIDTCPTCLECAVYEGRNVQKSTGAIEGVNCYAVRRDNFNRGAANVRATICTKATSGIVYGECFAEFNLSKPMGYRVARVK